MKHTDQTNLIAEALQTPPIAFEESAPATQAQIEILQGVAIHLATIAAYMEARHLGKTHQSAVKEMNKTRAKVRAALGYSITRPINI